MKKLLASIALSCWVFVSVAQANDTISVGNVSAEPGTSVKGFIVVPDSGDGHSTTIPVTVFNGRDDGPVLGLIAGIHGSEYAPILAMQRMAPLIDPASLRGAVILVHIANLPAFQGRSIYVGPLDRKNLNRSFPGSAEGSITERIAHALTTELMDQSDYLIDIHAGDANESLRPSYSAYYAEAGSDRVIAESERIAVAFGLGTVVQFPGEVTRPRAAIYTSAQAVLRGIPAMDVESGGMGSTDEWAVEPIVEGVLGVLSELDMIPAEPAESTPPLIISERTRVNSDHDGIWYPNERIRAGDYIHEGAQLGHITDYHGSHLATINAPSSGVLLIRFGTPPVNRGDPLIVIGKTED